MTSTLTTLTALAIGGPLAVVTGTLAAMTLWSVLMVGEIKPLIDVVAAVLA